MRKKIFSVLICFLLADFCLVEADNNITKGRIIHLPKDNSIGWLRIRDIGLTSINDWQNFTAARGDVFVPEGKELKLQLDAKYISSLSSLGPYDIQELSIVHQFLSDKDLENLKGLTGLESLWLSPGCFDYSPLTGEGLANLAGMNNLRSLSINWTKITDDNLIHLKNLKNLEELILNKNDNLTGKGLVHLKDLKSLRNLTLTSDSVNNNSIQYICQLGSLNSLVISMTNITDDGVLQLKCVPNLKTLYLPSQITDKGFENLKGLNSLEELVTSSDVLTNAGLKHLENLPLLKKLSISSVNVTSEGIERLSKSHPNLEININLSLTNDAAMTKAKGLSRLMKIIKEFSKYEDRKLSRAEGLPCVTISTGTNVTDAGLAHLTGMDSLKKLYLNYTKITDAGLAHLKDLKNLEWLELRNTRITDAGLAHLKGLSSLVRLDLSQTKITDAGLVHLKGLKSLDTLFLSDTKITDAGLIHLKDLNNLALVFLDGTNITGEGLVLQRYKCLQ